MELLTAGFHSFSCIGGDDANAAYFIEKLLNLSIHSL